MVLAATLIVGCGGGGGGGGAAAVAPMASSAAPAAEPPKASVPVGDARAGCSVTLEGDSILWGGYGHNQRLAEPPAAALRRLRPAYAVIDNSAGGSTAAGRAPEFVKLPVGTRFVVLEHGINDGLFGRVQDLAPALRSMVAHVKDQGATPVITGIARPARQAPARDAADAVARQVAADTGAWFADWGAVPVEPAEMADVLHPGPAYSARLVERLAEVLDAAAPECAP